MNWCSGDACDPCGFLLARLHPISGNVSTDLQTITENWGPAGCDTDLTGKTILGGGFIQCASMSTPSISPPYNYLSGAGVWSGPEPYSSTLVAASYGDRIDPAGYTVSISGPGPGGSASNTNVVATPDYAAGVDVGTLGSFTITATTTGYFSVTPGSVLWSFGFGDSMFIGGFAAWIKYRN